MCENRVIMSLKRNCDGCGAIITDDSVENDFPSLVIYIGESEEPSYEYEDLCESCMSKIIGAIENALSSESEPVETHVVVEKQTEPQPIVDMKPIEPQHIEHEDASETEKEEPVTNDETGSRTYANGIINQFPIKSMRTNH